MGYVGFADDRAATEYEVVAVVDLLAMRPDWEELLQLPPGWLVVLEGDTVEAVFDSNGKAAWPSETRESGG